MITSRQMTILLEQWLQSVPSPFKANTIVDIYVNPTSSDIMELRKARINTLRFIADSKIKKLYVWDGSSLLHGQVAKSLGIGSRIDFYQSIPDQTLIGSAMIEGGKLRASYSDYFYQIIKDLNHYRDTTGVSDYFTRKLNYFLSVKSDFKWLSPYLDISEFINIINRNLK